MVLRGSTGRRFLLREVTCFERIPPAQTLVIHSVVARRPVRRVTPNTITPPGLDETTRLGQGVLGLPVGRSRFASVTRGHGSAGETALAYSCFLQLAFRVT